MSFEYPDDPQMDAEPPKNFVKRLHDGDYSAVSKASPGLEVLSAAATLINVLKQFKPYDRSDQDRHFAVAITDAEKLAAYIQQYLI